ncbi:MAG: alpha/beta hydrolase, partial [Acidimicrobiia bacterium]
MDTTVTTVPPPPVVTTVASSSTTATRAMPSTTSTTMVTTTTEADAEGVVEEIRGLLYTDRQQLDVFVPEGGADAVVVLLHGRGGDRQRFERQAGDIAAAGALVYNVSWRYRPPRFIEGIDDVACAVRYARATASEYGGDPQRVVVVGFSAGAWAGAVVGLSGDHEAGSCLVEEGSAFPDAFVGVSGAYDVATTGPA